MTPARTFLRAAVSDMALGIIGLAFTATMAGICLYAFYLAPLQSVRGNELGEMWVSAWAPLLWFPFIIFALFAAACLAYLIVRGRRIWLTYQSARAS